MRASGVVGHKELYELRQGVVRVTGKNFVSGDPNLLFPTSDDAASIGDKNVVVAATSVELEAGSREGLHQEGAWAASSQHLLSLTS